MGNTFGSSPFRLFSSSLFCFFFGNLLYENFFERTFHVINCIKTCQREQVNKFSHYLLHVKCHVNNF